MIFAYIFASVTRSHRTEFALSFNLDDSETKTDIDCVPPCSRIIFRVYKKLNVVLFCWLLRLFLYTDEQKDCYAKVAETARYGENIFRTPTDGEIYELLQ
jgi:hypothetical protein